jgi:hypothetical protein
LESSTPLYVLARQTCLENDDRDENRGKKALILTCANWVDIFNWDWYCILTFRKVVGWKTSWRIFHKWKSSLKHTVGHPIFYLLVGESPRFLGDEVHFHVLLKGVDGQLPYLWQQKWYRIAGWAKITVYRSGGNVKFYLGRKIADGIGFLTCSRDLKSKIKTAKLML